MLLDLIKDELRNVDANLTNVGESIYNRNIKLGFPKELCYLGLFVPFLESPKKKSAILIFEKYFGKNTEKIKDIETIKEIELLKDDTIKEVYKKNPQKVYEIIFTKLTQIDIVLALMSAKVNELAQNTFLPNEKIFLEFVEKVYSQISQILGISIYTSLFDDFVITKKYPKRYQKVLKITKDNLTRSKEEIDIIKSKLKKYQKYPNEIIKGRLKSPSSVFKKVYVRKEKPENILDFVAIRIITNTISDCYSWLEIIRNLWPKTCKFSDYIKHPKPNGYKSIHIVIDTENGPVEIQIRTHKMDKEAEFGISAHWQYKTKSNSKILKKVGLLLKTQDPNLGKGYIFVYTPKKDIIFLEKGSCVIDFAYAIHTTLGNHLSHAEINNKVANLYDKLKDKDVVKIYTDNKKKPKRKWLEYVVTKKARDKISQTLKIKPLNKIKRTTETPEKYIDKIQV